MSSSQTPDFGRLAATYDELRPLDEGWWELFDALVREGGLAGQRVLEVGCGTGRLAARLAERSCRVWGVEPSSEMLEHARAHVPRGVGLKLGAAEALPFKDGWFDRVVMRLVVHLIDRPRAFAEARRVLAPGGRLVVATFDRAHFDGYWLNSFFPLVEVIDRARFPTPEALVAELEAAGFAAVRLARLSQRRAATRDEALERIRGRFISTMQLIGEAEYRAGLERAERELPERIEYALEWLIAVAERAA